MDGRQAGTSENGTEHLDRAAAGVDVDEGLPPSAVVHGEAEGQVVEQLVGDDDAGERLVGHSVSTEVTGRPAWAARWAAARSTAT